MQKELLSDITAEPVVLKTISIPSKSKYNPPKGFRDAIMQYTGLKKRTPVDPKIIKIELRPATLRTALRCTEFILGMTRDSDKKGIERLFDIMSNNTADMAYIIAMAVHNKPGKVPESLAELILDNFTNEEMMYAAEEVYRGLGTESFFATMELFKGIKIANDIPETTAFQPSSETSN